MTREEYLNQLKRYLKKLPQKDYESAIEYFTEYFEDAGVENEKIIMEELGTPKEAARELLRNLLAQKTDNRGDKVSLYTIIVVAVLAVLISPIGLPVVCIGLIAIFLVVFLMFLLLTGTIYFEKSLLVLGGKLLLQGIVTVPHSLSGAAVVMGTGMFEIGAGIIFAILAAYGCKWIVNGMAGFIKWLTEKRSV